MFSSIPYHHTNKVSVKQQWITVESWKMQTLSEKKYSGKPKVKGDKNKDTEEFNASDTYSYNKH